MVAIGSGRVSIAPGSIRAVAASIIFQTHLAILRPMAGPIGGVRFGVRPGGRRIDAAQHHFVEENIRPAAQDVRRLLPIC